MSLTSQLTRQHFDQLHQSSIAYQWARYVLGMQYKLLPPEIVHQGKRIVLDALGCAIGAAEAPGRRILENSVRVLGGLSESTVFGSGIRTSATNATLTNCFMIRYLDCNDMGGGGHNSDSVGAILAVAEREGSSGKDFLTSLVLCYELGARIREAGIGHGTGGWSSDVRDGLTIPAPLGRLMGLNEDQMANAIAISGVRTPFLGIADADNEEMGMDKNLRFGFAAQHAIVSCILAKGGFTGHVRVFEGDKGFNQMILNNQMKLERLINFAGWRIMNGGFKTLCQSSTSQGHILATLAIVKEHDLKPSDIAAVHIKACEWDDLHLGSLSRRYPRDGETGTHSAYFGQAIAIKERSLGPKQLTPEKYDDPVVLELVDKITLEVDHSLPRFSYTGTSEITTKDGRRFEKRVDLPHGYEGDPFTDEELIEKFRGLTELYVDRAQVQSIIDTVWNIDKLQTIGDLTKLLVWE